MHPSQRQLHITPIEEPLYVVAAIDNAEQFASRYRHYSGFAKHVADSGAILYTVEVAHGQRNFEVTESGNPHHIQLRCHSEIWRKENLQNIGVSRLPHGWQYVLLHDADMVNTRPDWAQATVQALQRYDAVQTFSTYSCLRSDHTVESVADGFLFARAKGKGPTGGYYHGAPGGAWAYRRSAWDALEGLLQTPILGSADWYMTHALIGQCDDAHTQLTLQECSPGYVSSITDWSKRAAALKGNVGFVENHALHFWHGPYKSRGYDWRWKILRTWQFDPATDLKTDGSGLLELAGNKPGMRDEIRAYFRSRNEDQI